MPSHIFAQPLRKSLSLAALLLETEARASEAREAGKFTEAGREMLGSAKTLRQFMNLIEKPAPRVDDPVHPALYGKVRKPANRG
jgi:hypothetical protein